MYCTVVKDGKKNKKRRRKVYLTWLVSLNCFYCLLLSYSLLWADVPNANTPYAMSFKCLHPWFIACISFVASRMLIGEDDSKTTVRRCCLNLEYAGTFTMALCIFVLDVLHLSLFEVPYITLCRYISMCESSPTFVGSVVTVTLQCMELVVDILMICLIIKIKR